MKLLKTTLFLIALLVSIKCSDDESEPKWKELTPFPGAARHFAPAVHGNNAYLFFGHKGFSSTSEFSRSVWRYTSEDDTWTELTPFEGSGRSRSTAFAIDNSIYIVGGTMPTDDPEDFDGLTITDDVLKYDITTDTWDQLSPFPGGPTSDGMAFKVGNEFFYGFGLTQNRTLWKYNAVEDEWIQRADFPGEIPLGQTYTDYSILFPRLTNFVYDNKIFVVTCESTGTRESTEMWQYDVLTDEWSEITDITFDNDYSRYAYRGRGGTVSYVHKNKCYFLLGISLDDFINGSVHSFDPQSHELRMLQTPPGPNFIGSGAFLIYTGSEIIVGSDYSSRYDKGFELSKLKL